MLIFSKENLLKDVEAQIEAERVKVESQIEQLVNVNYSYLGY